jgi:hypothetical protein
MGARVIETEFYRVIFIKTESRSCTPFVYTVRVDRSRYNDAYVGMPVSKTSRSTARNRRNRFGDSVVRYSFVSPVVMLLPKTTVTKVFMPPQYPLASDNVYLFINLKKSCLIAVGKTDVSAGSRDMPASCAFLSRRFRHDVLFGSSFGVYYYSGRFGIAFV